MVRTMALWGYNRKVVYFLTIGFLEFVVSTRLIDVPLRADSNRCLLYCCQVGATFTVQETITWSQIPSVVELNVVRCLATTQDKDVWPAYVCLILGETGEHTAGLNRSPGADLRITVVAVVVLTVLRRLLDPDRTSTLYVRTRKLIPDRYLLVGGVSRCRLVRTMYRDGGCSNIPMSGHIHAQRSISTELFSYIVILGTLGSRIAIEIV